MIVPHTSGVRPGRVVSTCRELRSLFKSSTRLHFQSSLATIAKCPEPTCACAEMPPDLDIDRRLPLDGTMAAYRHHAVVRTGVSDWPSKIEDDDRFPLVQSMRQRFGRGGKFHDPFNNNTMLSTSSHPAQSPSILLFPSFKSLSGLCLSPMTAKNEDPHTLGSQVDALITRYLFTPVKDQDKLDKDVRGPSDVTCSPIHHLTVLICGHGARDSRCGIMGALLEEEFKTHLKRARWQVDESAIQEPITESSNTQPNENTATVELISHIGGHKFAGNVILYIPRVGRWRSHPLAGMGIWYGRVEPSHVDGIIKETVEKGVIIQELFRGGVSDGGDTIHL